MTILRMRNELGVEVSLKSDEFDINIETQGCVTPQVGKKSDAHFDQSFSQGKTKMRHHKLYITYTYIYIYLMSQVGAR